MATVRADAGACEGYGNCVQSAPTIFTMDDDDVVVVLKDEVTGDELKRAQEAAMACPVRALQVDRE